MAQLDGLPSLRCTLFCTVAALLENVPQLTLQVLMRARVETRDFAGYFRIPNHLTGLIVCVCVCVCVCVYLPVSLSLCLSASVCLSGCLPVYLSVCLSVCLSLSLSLSLSL